MRSVAHFDPDEGKRFAVQFQDRRRWTTLMARFKTKRGAVKEAEWTRAQFAQWSNTKINVRVVKRRGDRWSAVDD